MGPLSPHSLYLLLDATTPNTQVGLWQAGAFIAFSSSEEPPVVSLFAQVQALLKNQCLNLKDIDGIMYCEGPGSVLGIRLTLMAVRAWKHTHSKLNLYAYNSLALGAALVRCNCQISEPFTFIAPGRQQRWHALNNDNLKEIDAETLSTLSSPFYTLPQRKKSFCLPTEVHIIDYNLNTHAELLNSNTLLTLTETPEMFNQTEATYKPWKPDRHR